MSSVVVKRKLSQLPGKRVEPGDSVNIGVRVAAGVTTGTIAITCAQPTDVVKVRMQAQRAGAHVRYAGTTQAYRAIATTEGVRGLWKGVYVLE